VIGLTFDESAANPPEGQTTLDLAVRLLARLYPAIAINPVGSAADDLATRLRALALGINDQIEMRHDLSRATVVLSVGVTASAGEYSTIFTGSDGWRARLSRTEPVGSGTTSNPFGAGAAA
jgi:hypothetical protein